MTLSLVTMTPLGCRVDPEVYCKNRMLLWLVCLQVADAARSWGAAHRMCAVTTDSPSLSRSEPVVRPRTGRQSAATCATRSVVHPVRSVMSGTGTGIAPSLTHAKNDV